MNKGKGSIPGSDNSRENERTNVTSGSKRPFFHDVSSSGEVSAYPFAPQPYVDVIESLPEDSDTSDESSSDEDSIASRHAKRRASSSHYIKIFLEKFDKLSSKQISEPLCIWECPIFYAGRGDIRKFKLPSLLSHLKTFLTKRVSIHRRLAKRVEEVVRVKGLAGMSQPQAYKLWMGFSNDLDHQIVWPPMVIVVNTRLDLKDTSNKWLGMGNPELLSYYEEYHVVKACHSYGPEGHRGISVLIFEDKQSGYFAAESLHHRFVRARVDRSVWASGRCKFVRGLRQLHGYLATNEDMIDFNRHSQGNSVIKFEVKSYKDMVVNKPVRARLASASTD